MLRTTRRQANKTSRPRRVYQDLSPKPDATPIARVQGSYGNQATVRSLRDAGVRLHLDSPRAVALDALAVTEGADIHVAPGEWAPDTHQGRETLGHELAHVMQQRAGRVRPTAVRNGAPVNDQAGLEAEADAFGRRFAESGGEMGFPVLPAEALPSAAAMPAQRRPKGGQKGKTKGKTKEKAKTPPKEEEPKKASPPSGGTIAEGDPLTDAEIVSVRAALKKATNKRYIVYRDVIKVGGTLAWRANNPGNLRSAATQIAKVPGATGHFAVFATLEDGEAAQRALYLDKYGEQKVRDAVAKLTPPSENDTEAYLQDLKGQGIDLDKSVKEQIDPLMAAIKVNEGSGAGTEIARTATE